MKRNLLFLPLLLAMGLVVADDVPEDKPAPGAAEEQAPKDPSGKVKKQEATAEQAKKEEDAKALSGMSILGNQEAPKSLVIVPWKGSELGSSLGIAPMLDDSRKPIDKEVFMRALSYYEIRSGRK